MTKLYLDHTEFKVNTASSVSDTIVMGGLLISHEEEKKLIHLIREVKSRYFNPDLPLKFNMRDLKKNMKSII